MRYQVKIKLLTGINGSEQGEIFEALKNNNFNFCYYYDREDNLQTAFEPNFEIVKDEPEVKRTEVGEKFDSYQKNMIDLIRDLSAVVSEVKFK